MIKSIKKREFPESNYRGIFFNGKTIRIALDLKKPITKLEYPEFYDVDIFETGNGLCKANCQYCFTENTLISTEKGEKKIKDIAIDDKVFSINKKTGDIILSFVDQLHVRNFEGDLIMIELENGKILEVTPNHKIFTSNRGWIKAKNIETSDILLKLSDQ